MLAFVHDASAIVRYFGIVMARTRTVYLCLRQGPFRTWFCVKMNGSLHIVHDPPAPLMQSPSAMPQVLPFVEGMAARACCSMPNPFVGGNDHSVHVLDISSRDLTATSFLPTPSSAPFGAPFFPKVGIICQFAIFHSDVTFILEPEIPHVATSLAL